MIHTTYNNINTTTPQQHTVIIRYVTLNCTILCHLYWFWTRGGRTKEKINEGRFPNGWPCRIIHISLCDKYYVLWWVLQKESYWCLVGEYMCRYGFITVTWLRKREGSGATGEVFVITFLWGDKYELLKKRLKSYEEHKPQEEKTANRSCSCYIS